MDNLENMISRYGNMKAEMDSYKKQVNKDNADIKELIKTEGTKIDDNKWQASGGGYIATLNVVESESFDDDKLVNKLQEVWSAENGSMTNPYLKRMYVPDMEAIENAIYNGKLDAASLADCRVVKQTPRLTIKKEAK